MSRKNFRVEIFQHLILHLTSNVVHKLLQKFIDDLNSDSESNTNSSFFKFFDVEKYEEIVFSVMKQINETRYLQLRFFIIKFIVLINICLKNYKSERFDFFRLNARMNSFTFDRLVEILKFQFFFHNDFINQQMSVQRQILIILKRFETYDNDSIVICIEIDVHRRFFASIHRL